MAIEAVLQFLEATSKDDSLRSDLAGIIGVGDGDISTADALDQDEIRALLGARGVLAATFADQQGYKFTVAELNVVIGVIQRYQAGELSEADFNAALGLQGAGPQTQERLKAAGKSVGIVYRGIRYEKEVKEDINNAPQVMQFMHKTAEDDSLREQLKTILGVGDGDISNFAELDQAEEQALKSERGALVAEFAAKQGFLFTMADLFAVTDAFQRVQSGEMSEDAFKKYLRLSGQTSDLFPFIQKVSELTYKGFRYATAIPSPGQDNTLQVVRFMEASKADPKLREELQAIVGGDGDISDPTQLDAEEARSLIGDRSSRIVDLGAAHGFRFTVSDLSAVVGAFQLVETGELPLDNCMRILGLKGAGTNGESGLADVASTAGRIYRGVRI